MAEQGATLLQLVPGRGQLTALAVPDGHDVPRTDEDAELAGLHGVTLVDVPEGAQDDDDRLAEPLDLGPLVGLEGVLDGELVQVEQALDAAHLGVRRIVQADPAEALAVVVDGLGNGLGVPGQVLPFALGVHAAVHDHATIMAPSLDRTG